MNIKQAEEIVELVRKHKLEKAELDKIENIQKNLSMQPNRIEDCIAVALDLKHRPSTFVIRNLVDSLKAEQSKRVAEIRNQIEKIILVPPAPRLPMVNHFFSMDFGFGPEWPASVHSDKARGAGNAQGPVDGVKQEGEKVVSNNGVKEAGKGSTDPVIAELIRAIKETADELNAKFKTF